MPRFSDDSLLNEFFELGKSTVQKTGQSIKSVTLGSLQKAIEEISGSSQQSNNPLDKGMEKLEQGGKKQNHTPLDFRKLQENYQKQDQQKMTDVRSKLWQFFNLEKQEEKKAIEWFKNKEEERKRRIAQEEQEKKKKEEMEKKQTPPEEPKGKVRRSIFAPKKAVKRSQAETRVGSGKQ